MIDFENIKNTSDHELVECISIIQQKLLLRINSLKQYIHKVRKKDSTKESYLNMLQHDLKLISSSHGFLSEIIERFKDQPISISNEVWQLAIQDAKDRGRPGTFGFQILINDYSVTDINILSNERPTK